MLGRPPGEGELEPFTLALLEHYRRRPPGALEDALAIFASQKQTMASYLAEVDVTLCPTTPVDLFELGTLAPTLDRETLLARTDKLAGYTPIHNIAGVPAMSVPLHLDERGWPVGSHFAAAEGQEAKLLALAYELERAAPWAHRRPPEPG